MNQGTLVVVSGYAGDAHQISELLPYYEHHERPILLLSPEDSPIPFMGTLLGRSCGKRGYTGQESLDRQHRHLMTALEYPFEWFLFHDSDSICISPEIPAYLFERDDVIWSNQIDDHREKGYHDPLPHIAMQPPYFMSRRVLREYVLHGAQKADQVTPFIDWYMVQVAYAAGVQHHGFRSGACFPTDTSETAAYMGQKVYQGARMVHSVKTRAVADDLKRAYLAAEAAG